MSSLLPQNIDLTDEEERLLDGINASLADEAEAEGSESEGDESDQSDEKA